MLIILDMQPREQKGTKETKGYKGNKMVQRRTKGYKRVQKGIQQKGTKGTKGYKGTKGCKGTKAYKGNKRVHTKKNTKSVRREHTKKYKGNKRVQSEQRVQRGQKGTLSLNKVSA